MLDCGFGKVSLEHHCIIDESRHRLIWNWDKRCCSEVGMCPDILSYWYLLEKNVYYNKNESMLLLMGPKGDL